MPRSLSAAFLLALLLSLLGGTVIVGVPTPAALAADPPVVHPFVVLARDLRVDRAIEAPGAIVFVLKLASGSQSGLAARVGLRESNASILALPSPAGDFHVRVSNPLTVPLEIVPGETLLSSVGPSRSADRTVWILPGASAFVPVIHSDVLPPPGPYLTRGRGLTPFEQERIREGQWDERVRSRNQAFGVDTFRIDDAAAAYATQAFEDRIGTYRAAWASVADSDLAVGIVACDHRGAYFARVEADTDRFRQAWPSLLDGIAMDAIIAVREGRNPWNGVPETRRELAAALHDVETSAPASRPAFGTGREYRWALKDDTGVWTGLAIGERPVSLTLVRNPPVRGVVEPPNPEKPDPGPAEADRRARPSVFEQRYGDRRDGTPGSVTPGGPGGGPIGGPAGGSAGGAPPGPSAPLGPSAPPPAPPSPPPGPAIGGGGIDVR